MFWHRAPVIPFSALSYQSVRYNPPPRAFRSEVRTTANVPLDVAEWTSYDQYHGHCSPMSPGVPGLIKITLLHTTIGSENAFKPMSTRFLVHLAHSGILLKPFKVVTCDDFASPFRIGPVRSDTSDCGVHSIRALNSASSNQSFQDLSRHPK